MNAKVKLLLVPFGAGVMVAACDPAKDESVESVALTEPTTHRPAIRRIFAGGYDYGDCSFILTVLLDPEPCASVWGEAQAQLVRRVSGRGLD